MLMGSSVVARILRYRDESNYRRSLCFDDYVKSLDIGRSNQQVSATWLVARICERYG